MAVSKSMKAMKFKAMKSMKAMKATKRAKATKYIPTSKPDFDLLSPPYSNYIRELWNSREHLRMFMHSDKAPQCQLKWTLPGSDAK